MTEVSNTTTPVLAAGLPTPVLEPAFSNPTLPRPESSAAIVSTPQNINSSEYQSAYQWKLPIVQAPRPKPERAKSEYQREFTWKEPSTTTSSNASTPIPPADLSRPSSSANNLAPSRADTPVVRSPSSANINNSGLSRTNTPVMPSTPEPPRILDEVVLPQLTTIATTPSKPAENIIKHNGGFVNEPEDFNVAVQRFMKSPSGISTERSNNKWATSLRKENEKKESAASLDKNIVALEANRLSKKSRSYSMYSLRDQLKTIEAADDLANPMVSEYKREFVDWGEYGHEIREESAHRRKEEEEEPKLRRRGSWSAPLPAPLKWLGDLRKKSEKLQPTITDAKSIRSSNNRSEPKRPVTSAECRDYHDYDDFATSGSRHNRLNKDGYYTASHQQTGLSSAYPSDTSDNYYPVRSSEERHHYDSIRTREPTYDRRREYDDYPTSRGAGLDYNARRESTNRLHDPVYDEPRDYDDRDRGYDRSYSDRRTDRHLDERPRDRNYDRPDDKIHSEKIYDDHRGDKAYGDRTRDQYYYDEPRREPENDHRSRNRVSQLIEQDRYSERGSHSGSDLDRYSDRGSDHDRYSNHSRNTSYSSQASSLHKGLREELLTHSNISPIYTDNYRSSVSSNSSASTPSLPSTPREYDTSDSRWKKGSLSDLHIHKDDLYSQTLYSKPSQKPWNPEDDRWQGYNQSTKKGFYIDEDEPIELNGRSQRQSAYSTPPPLEGGNYRGVPASRGRQMYASPGRSPLASAPRSPTRSPSPSDGSRRYHRGMTSPTYPSRPDSRATSVSSHGTSMEEESAVMIDMLRAADNDLMKSLTQQMSVFRAVREVTPKVGTVPMPGTKKKTVKPGSKSKTATAAATAKSGTTKSTTPKTATATKNVRAAGLPTPGIKRPTTKNPLTNLTKGRKGHKSTSSASSVSSTGSYAGMEDRPNPTSFNEAREALNRARMQVEQMLELVNNGGFEM